MIEAVYGKLAANLPGDLPVYEGWQDLNVPPLVLIAPPRTGAWIETEKFGYRVHVDVLVVAANGPDRYSQLVAMVEGVLAQRGDFAVSSVDAPGLITLNGTKYLGTFVHLNKQDRM